MNSPKNSLMTPHSIEPAARDDDFKARERRIRRKILDGIEETLDELAQPRGLHAAIEPEQISNEARRAMRAQCAALLCRQALCRRAKRCRRHPCAVPESASGLEEAAQRDCDR